MVGQACEWVWLHHNWLRLPREACFDQAAFRSEASPFALYSVFMDVQQFARSCLHVQDLYIITKWPDDFNCLWQTCHRRGMFWIHPLILRASFLFALNIHLAQHPSWTPCHGFLFFFRKKSMSYHLNYLLFLLICLYTIFSNKMSLPAFSLYPPYSIFKCFTTLFRFFSNNPRILTITWFCSCGRDLFLFIFYIYIYIY